MNPNRRFIRDPETAFNLAARGTHLLERVSDSSRSMTAYVVFKECGQQYALFFSETDWIGEFDDMLSVMVQISSRADLDSLEATGGPSWKDRYFASEFAPSGETPTYESGLNNGERTRAFVM